MNHQSTLAVARVIQRHEPLAVDVLSCRHEIQWADGSRVGLHPVRKGLADAHQLRAVHHEGHWVLFDLAKVTPKIVADMKTAPERDYPGLVLYALRKAFHNAPDFLEAISQKPLARWEGEDREPSLRPSKTGALPVALYAGVDLPGRTGATVALHQVEA